MNLKMSSVTKNYIYNLMYQVLLLISPLIVTPYVSRTLGAEGIGTFSYVQSIATYFSTFGAIGSSLYAQREMAKYQENEKKRSALFFEIFFLRVITVACSLGVYLAMYVPASQYPMLALILALDILAVMLDITWLFQGMEAFKSIVTRNAIVKVLGIVFIFVFVKNKEDLLLYALCHSVPVIIGNLTLWGKGKQYFEFNAIKQISIKRIFSHVKPVLVLFVPQLASQIYTVLDKTMLGALSKSMEEVGYYEQAQKIIKIALMSVTSLGTVLLPRMSKAIADDDQKNIYTYMKKSFIFVFALGFPIMFGIIGIADRFVPWFYGVGFNEVKYLLILFAPIVIIMGLSSSVGYQYMIAAQQQTFYTLSIVSGAMINVLLNYVFIPKFSSIGATLSSLAAELTVTMIQLYAVRKNFNLVDFFRLAPRYFFSACLMGTVVYAVGIFWKDKTSVVVTFLQIMIGVIVYVGILFLRKDQYLLECLSVFKDRKKK